MPDGKLVLTTLDHPCANGRDAQHGDQQWAIDVPLQDGTMLHLRMGRKGRELLLDMLLQENAADAAAMMDRSMPRGFGGSFG